jgi:hypothetical protein
MNHFQCKICGKQDALIFQCNYCRNYFCVEHHLPENHDCTNKPRAAPFYVRPFGGEFSEPSPTINYPLPKQHSKTKLLKKIAAVFALAIIAVLLLYSTYPILHQLTQNPSGLSAPTLTTTYVEVNYRTVGWFYSESWGSSYNYTYLVLNVAITNHGYSQVNVFGDNGFSVLIDNSEYLPSTLVHSLHNSSGTYYVNYPYVGTTTERFNLGSSLPSSAKLLDTGSSAGIIVFKLGDPDVYPPQPQILNKPFTLKYSVTYGEHGFILTGPYAKVVINQIG